MEKTKTTGKKDKKLSLVQQKDQRKNITAKEALIHFLQNYGILCVLILLIVIMASINPAFRSLTNATNVLRQVSIIGIISMGVTFAIITGGIDLSSGSMVAFVGVVVASMSQHTLMDGQPLGVVMPIVFAIILALLLGTALGGVNGALIAYARIPPFIATLGMMTIARGFALLYSAGRPIGNLKPAFTFIGAGSFLNIPIPIWIYAVMAVVSYILLSKSRFGRYVLAIGGNRQAARIAGINVETILLRVYMYAGMLSAISAVILVARTTAGNPSYGMMYELDAIAATVIGGTSLSGGIGSIPMCVVGAIFIGIINNSMDLIGVNPYWQQIVKGLIIVAAVVIDSTKNRKR